MKQRLHNNKSQTLKGNLLQVLRKNQMVWGISDTDQMIQWGLHKQKMFSEGLHKNQFPQRNHRKTKRLKGAI